MKNKAKKYILTINFESESLLKAIQDMTPKLIESLKEIKAISALPTLTVESKKEFNQ